MTYVNPHAPAEIQRIVKSKNPKDWNRIPMCSATCQRAVRLGNLPQGGRDIVNGTKAAMSTTNHRSDPWTSLPKSCGLSVKELKWGHATKRILKRVQGATTTWFLGEHKDPMAISGGYTYFEVV